MLPNPSSMPADHAQTADCAAVVLAAGEARRFGAPKLLLPFGESTVIGSVVGALTAAGVAPILVVVGRDAAAVEAAVAGRAQVVLNPDPSRGMLSSLRIGVAALPEGMSRLFLALGDQPRLRPRDLTHLLNEQTRTGKGIAMPMYQGKRGHPILLRATYRQGILELTDAQTLRDLLHAHFEDTVEVACDSDAVTSDIDTQEQYQDELRKLARDEAGPVR